MHICHVCNLYKPNCLYNILQSLGLVAELGVYVREGMDASTKHNSPELRVFKLYFSKLVESISHPECLANELYSHDVISKGVRDDTHTMGPSAYYRASKLVAAVESQIVLSPLILHTFLSVVRGDPSLVYIADAISDHYRKCSVCTYVIILLIVLNDLAECEVPTSIILCVEF